MFDVVVFGGVKIDVILLEFESFVYIDKNVLKNLFFEFFKCFLLLDNFSMYDMCILFFDFIFYYWLWDFKSCVVVLLLIKNLVREGNFFLFIKGSLK